MFIGKRFDTKTSILLSDEARKANLAVFGIKNTGKAYTLIPVLFNQDIKNKDRGVTIVVDTPKLAWYLYGMCKVLGRKEIEIIKPSIDEEIIDGLLFRDEWNYDDVKKIFDYENAIKKKKVVIIDMEQERYGEKATRAVSMLLLQLQAAMIMDYKEEVDYSVFIDDAATYLPYIHNLLKYGDYFGFTATLFMKSRAELGDEKIWIDDYVRNYILLQGINYDDALYFGERMGLTNNAKSSAQQLLKRPYGTIQYEILKNGSYERDIGTADLFEFEEKKKTEFAQKATYWQKRMKEKHPSNHHYQLQKEKEELSTNTKQSYTKDLEDDMNKTLQEEPKKLEVELENSISEPIEVDVDEEIELEEPVEPQLNKQLAKKPAPPKKKEPDFSALDKVIDEIDIDDEEIELEEPEIEDIPVQEEQKPKQEYDLSTTFSLKKNGYMPYKKIKNKKIANELEGFKL